jgi:hypothetical protein
MGRASAGRLVITLARLGYTITPSLGHPHSQKVGGQGSGRLSDPCVLRCVTESVWGCNVHSVNPQGENVSADCLQ